MVEHGIKDVVHRSPLHQPLKVKQESTDRLRRRMRNELGPNIPADLKAGKRVVHLLFGHGDDGGASQLNTGLSHGWTSHQRQNGHQRLNHGLQCQQALPISHHGDVSRTQPSNEVGQVFP